MKKHCYKKTVLMILLWIIAFHNWSFGLTMIVDRYIEKFWINSHNPRQIIVKMSGFSHAWYESLDAGRTFQRQLKLGLDREYIESSDAKTYSSQSDIWYKIAPGGEKNRSICRNTLMVSHDQGESWQETNLRPFLAAEQIRKKQLRRKKYRHVWLPFRHSCISWLIVLFGTIGAYVFILFLAYKDKLLKFIVALIISLTPVLFLLWIVIRMTRELVGIVYYYLHLCPITTQYLFSVAVSPISLFLFLAGLLSLSRSTVFIYCSEKDFSNTGEPIIAIVWGVIVGVVAYSLLLPVM